MLKGDPVKMQQRIAWGITGSGHQLIETFEVMKHLKNQYYETLEVSVYLSKAGEQVASYYQIINELRNTFNRIWVEHNANTPFLAGQLQTGKFDLLLIAPATSNTVAKITAGIGDTLLTNSAIMGLKASIPLFIMPSDYKEGIVITKLPNGNKMNVKVRREDAYNVKKLEKMHDVFIIKTPNEIRQFLAARVE